MSKYFSCTDNFDHAFFKEQIILTKKEANIIREWFASIEDLSHKEFLEVKDYQLYTKILYLLGWKDTATYYIAMNRKMEIKNIEDEEIDS